MRWCGTAYAKKSDAVKKRTKQKEKATVKFALINV